MTCEATSQKRQQANKIHLQQQIKPSSGVKKSKPPSMIALNVAKEALGNRPRFHWRKNSIKSSILPILPPIKEEETYMEELPPESVSIPKKTAKIIRNLSMNKDTNQEILSTNQLCTHQADFISSHHQSPKSPQTTPILKVESPLGTSQIDYSSLFYGIDLTSLTQSLKPTPTKKKLPRTDIENSLSQIFNNQAINPESQQLSIIESNSNNKKPSRKENEASSSQIFNNPVENTESKQLVNMVTGASSNKEGLDPCKKPSLKIRTT